MLTPRIRYLVYFFSFLVLLLASSSLLLADSSLMGGREGQLTSAVKKALPREAMVIFVQEGEVYLDMTKGNGAVVGRKYTIERPGAEILHPVTGESLGRASIHVAEVQITWIQEGFSRAKIIGSVTEAGLSGSIGIHVKDVARPSEQPVIARFPIRHGDGSLSKLTEAMDCEIAATLNAITGASVVTGPAMAMSADIRAWSMAKAALMMPEVSVEVGGRIVGDTVEVFVVNLPSPSSGLSSIAIVDALKIPVSDSMKNLAAQKMTAPASAPAVSPAAPSPRTSMPSPALERVANAVTGEISIPLNFIPVDVTTGDVDGDGVDEIIIAENRSLRINRLKPDGTLEEIAKLSLGWGAEVFHITAGDIDKDGKAEIYVVEKPGNFVRSTGFRFTNGKLVKFFHEAGVFLRVVSSSEGDVLYAQRYGSTRPFDRGVLRYRFAGDKLNSSSAGLPQILTLYDFALIGSTGFIASLDYENKLRLYNHGGDPAWTSVEPYGGSEIKIESGDKRNSTEEHIGIEAADVDGDGTEEVVVVQNILEGFGGSGSIKLAGLQHYRSGRIVVMSMSGGELVERSKTKTYAGAIKGYSIGSPFLRGNEQARQGHSRLGAVFFTLEKLTFTAKRAVLRVIPLN